MAGQVHNGLVVNSRHADHHARVVFDSVTVDGSGPAFATYAYDTLGRRVAKAVTNEPAVEYVLTGAQVFSEYHDSVLTRSYAYGR